MCVGGFVMVCVYVKNCSLQGFQVQVFALLSLSLSLSLFFFFITHQTYTHTPHHQLFEIQNISTSHLRTLEQSQTGNLCLSLSSIPFFFLSAVLCVCEPVSKHSRTAHVSIGFEWR